jgi:hypothetical protein
MYCFLTYLLQCYNPGAQNPTKHHKKSLESILKFATGRYVAFLKIL